MENTGVEPALVGLKELNQKRPAQNVQAFELSGEYRSRTGDLPDACRDAHSSLNLVNKKGLNTSPNLSKIVENTGVEPVTSCMPCKRSSQLS